jgi:hypothetical protein
MVYCRSTKMNTNTNTNTNNNNKNNKFDTYAAGK